MKVIKDATAGRKSMRRNCKKCKSTLEVSATDLRYVNDSRDGDAVVYACPVCKAENWVAASLVPKAVLIAVAR